MIIGNERRSSPQTASIRAPWDGAEVGRHPLGSAADMDAAITANVAAAEACRKMAAFERAACLRRIADALRERRGEFAALLAKEAGKPVTQAYLEIDRAIVVFADGAEEATRIAGEVLPLDVLPAGVGRLGLTPESLSRAFARLRSIGVVVDNSHVMVKDVAKLRQLASDDRSAVRGTLRAVR